MTLVTGATNLETRMRKYYDEARDGGYVAAPFMHRTGARYDDGGDRDTWSPKKLGSSRQKSFSMAADAMAGRKTPCWWMVVVNMAIKLLHARTYSYFVEFLAFG